MPYAKHSKWGQEGWAVASLLVDSHDSELLRFSNKLTQYRWGSKRKSKTRRKIKFLRVLILSLQRMDKWQHQLLTKTYCQTLAPANPNH